MERIDVAEIEKIIELTKGTTINVCFFGASGVGKTTVVREYCRKHKRFLKKLELAHLDASECLGIPSVEEYSYKGKTYKCMSTAIPKWVFTLLEHRDDPNPPVLFLDEFLCAEPNIQNAFLTFLTEKTVEDLDLSFVQIVAATNFYNYSFDPDMNILRRFCFFEIENNSSNKYGNIKDLPFVYKYEENVDKDNVLFEERVLCPRNAEQLTEIPEEYVDKFYCGFTNKHIIPLFSSGIKAYREVSQLVFPCYEFNNETGKYSLPDTNLALVVRLIKERWKTPSVHPKMIESLLFCTDKQKKDMIAML